MPRIGKAGIVSVSRAARDDLRRGVFVDVVAVEAALLARAGLRLRAV